MLRNKIALIAYLLNACLLIVPTVLSAQITERGKPSILGSIDIEDTKAVAVDAYQVSQEKALTYFDSLATAVSSPSSISTQSAPQDGVLHHMAGVYLYCIVKAGICPYLLDAIFEIDVINARLSGQAECPAMLRFWSDWKKNDLENRHKYLVSTGHMQLVSEFNRNKRTRYLLCKETVANEILSKETNAAFFKERYAEGSTIRKSVNQTNQLLKQIKTKIPNIFVATGAQSIK